MKKEVYEIDNNGFIKERYVISESEQTEFIKVSVPQGLYRPRWTGKEWIEDMTQEEIDEINNQSQIPTQEERINMLENMILMIMEG